jgi:hypothetical protein
MARRAEYGVVVEWIFCSGVRLEYWVWRCLEVWSTGVPPYLFGPSEVWRRRDAHFLECGGKQKDTPGHARTRPGHPRTHRGGAAIGPSVQGQGIVSESRKGGGVQDCERGGVRRAKIETMRRGYNSAKEGEEMDHGA